MSFVNNVKITLNAAITSSATSVQVVKAVAPFNDPPASGKLTLMDSLSGPTKIEIIAYTGRTDNSTYWTLTGVSRGQESTTASAFSSGDAAVQTWTAGQATATLDGLVVVGTTLPNPASSAGSLFYTTGDNKFYISDGTSWFLVANQGPTPTGGTVVIPSVVELSGSYSYNLGVDFTDDVHTDAQLTYTLESGVLPSGCVLPTSGNTAFTGTIPAVSSNTLFSFQIKATDSAGGESIQNYQQLVSNAVPIATGGTVTITDVVATSAVSYDVGVNFTFAAGSAFSAFSLQSGTLPAGTTLNTSTGVISGTVTTSVATYAFTIRATDTDGDVVDQSYSWSVIATSSLTATGGTITTSGLYTIHTFTSSGTFIPSNTGAVDILIIGGGGGGGNALGGGGGAGGVYYATGFTVSALSYAITIGAGGVGLSSGAGGSGANTTAFSVNALGGGGGGAYPSALPTTGANGGGAIGSGGESGAGGTALTAYSGFTSHGGFSGGVGVSHGGGGGGGAGGAGDGAVSTAAGDGGVGHANSINGSSLYWAGGGGGSSHNAGDGGSGGIGGGGGGGTEAGGGAGGAGGGSAYYTGGTGMAGASTTGGAGGAHTGSGGGSGTHSSGVGGNGASGIVIVRYLT